MWGLLAVFLAAAVISLAAVWASIKIAHRVGALDHPDSERKSQATPIPRLGGFAVALAYSAAAFLALLVRNEWYAWSAVVGVLIPAVMIALVGFLDDRSNLSPMVRLFLQAAAAGIAWVLGTQIVVTGLPFLDFMIFVLWVMIVINGINLLDNSDGLAASTALVASIGATVVAAMSGQQFVAVLGVSLAGVSAGFLWHNWAPARVYLGDAGAYFLGFMLAILAVRLRPENLAPISGVAIACLLLILPILDTTFVVVRRVRAGIHPFTAGRDHLSHALQARGFSVPCSVGALQAVSVLGAIGAVLVAANG